MHLAYSTSTCSTWLGFLGSWNICHGHSASVAAVGSKQFKESKSFYSHAVKLAREGQMIAWKPNISSTFPLHPGSTLHAHYSTSQLEVEGLWREQQLLLPLDIPFQLWQTCLLLQEVTSHPGTKRQKCTSVSKDPVEWGVLQLQDLGGQWQDQSIQITN